MKSKTLGFIGVGNMGSAFLHGFLSNDIQIFEHFALYDINPKALDSFSINKNIILCKVIVLLVIVKFIYFLFLYSSFEIRFTSPFLKRR